MSDTAFNAIIPATGGGFGQTLKTAIYTVILISIVIGVILSTILKREM